MLASRPRQISFRTIAWVFLPFICLVLAGVGLFNAYTETRESAMILIRGQAVESSIALVRGQTRDTPARSGSGDRWMLEVTYRYEVDGKPYESSRIGIEPIFAPYKEAVPPSWMQEQEAKYAEGQGIEVWVSPSDPSFSALVKAKNTWQWPLAISVVVGLIFIWIMRITNRND